MGAQSHSNLSHSALTKQHLSTKIFKGLFLHLSKKYPQVDVAKLVSECGLELRYFQEKGNWVSIIFLKNFSERLKSIVGSNDPWFEAGLESVSEAALGKALHFIAANVFSVDEVFKQLLKFQGLFNRLTNVEIVGHKKGQFDVRISPIFSELNSEEQEALRQTFEIITISAKGYYQAIPTIQGFLQAAVETKTVRSELLNFVSNFNITYDTKSMWTQKGAAIGIFVIGLTIFSVGTKLIDLSLLSASLIAILTVAILITARSLKMLQSFKKEYERVLEDLRRYDKKYLKEHQAREAAEKFVPWEFIKLLGHETLEEVSIGDSTTSEMTAMFFDLRGFSLVSEKLTSEEAVKFVNHLLARLVPKVQDNGGLIDKYEGDGFMAIFPSSANEAVRASVQIFEELAKFNKQRAELGDDPIRAGIGLARGKMTLGAVGNTKQIRLTTIADAVNVAARLEKLNKSYGTSVLMNEDAMNSLKSTQFVRRLGSHQLAGKQEATSIYQLYEFEPPEVRESISRNKDYFESAVKLLEMNMASEAGKIFAEIYSGNPGDIVSKQLSERSTGKKNVG